MDLKGMLNKFCPNGVKYLKLEDVVTFTRGDMITKKDITEGDVPVIAGGQTPAYYCDKSNREGESVVVAGSGAYAGFVSYWDIPIFVSDAFSVNPAESLVTKYLFYFLRSKQAYIYSRKKGVGVPHVYGKDLGSIPIPVPPIAIQEAIVRVLDKFTLLKAELEAELEARTVQYEHYRDALLDFSLTKNLNRTNVVQKLLESYGAQNVEYLELNQIFNIRNGYTPSKSNPKFWENGTVPWFRMEDIRENGTILADSIQKVTPEAIKGKLFPKNSIIIATSATIGDHALILEESLANQRFTYLYPKQEWKSLIGPKFIYYYCFVLGDWCRKNINVSGFASVNMDGFKKFPFPVPPLPVQEAIVDILDRFEAIVHDIQDGLPAEIALRQKQYEYYRDKLLTFEPLEPEAEAA